MPADGHGKAVWVRGRRSLGCGDDGRSDGDEEGEVQSGGRGVALQRLRTEYGK